MENLPEIRTITNSTEFKLKEKGSIFIAKSFPVANEDEANKVITQLEKDFFDATHHCYSYQLQNGIFKYSDDGEPNGTAGLRIFNAQNHFDLKNILTVVIRYFGGTKLGVGPLGKAYYEAAFGSLEIAKKISLELYQMIEISYDYSQSKNVHYLINKFDVKIINNDYSQFPQITSYLKINLRNQFQVEAHKFYPSIKISFENYFSYFEKKTFNI